MLIDEHILLQESWGIGRGKSGELNDKDVNWVLKAKVGEIKDVGKEWRHGGEANNGKDKGKENPKGKGKGPMLVSGPKHNNGILKQSNKIGGVFCWAKC